MSFSRISLALILTVPLSLLHAEEPKATPATPTAAELIKKLEQDLSGAKLVGRFTINGKEDAAPKPEEYTITSAKKLPEGDQWLIKAKMSYSKDDVPYPIPLDIKWAGDTPVMTMTDMEIPGLGTFSTRVVLYQGRYAGTWQHGKVGGHLFGTIEKPAPATDKPADKPAEPKP